VIFTHLHDWLAILVSHRRCYSYVAAAGFSVTAPQHMLLHVARHSTGTHVQPTILPFSNSTRPTRCQRHVTNNVVRCYLRQHKSARSCRTELE
jgi:hypothetical protein